jgi:hypothetical protein
VFALGEMIAQQKQNASGTNEVRWNYRNPVTGNQRGAIQTELDPFGRNHGLSEPQPEPPIIADSGIMNPGRYSDAFNGRFGCTADGAPVSCDTANGLLGIGAAEEVVAASAYYVIRNKATGKIISSGAFLLNSGAGVGMAFSSAFDGMGIMGGTVDFTGRQIRGATSANGAVNWSGLFTSLFGGTLEIEDGGDTSSLAGWGGDSSFAWVNINLGGNTGFVTNDSFTVNNPEHFKKFVIEFFKTYGQKFRRDCVWTIFAKDKDGNESNVATVMKQPNSSTFPYKNV